MARHRTLASIAAAAALVVFGACGNDSSPEAALSEEVDCESNPGETVTVDIPEFAFDPDPVSIKVCDSVVWRNSHTQPHTSTGEGADGWTTGNLAAGEESDPVTFSEAGTRTYICALHPFMTGTVEVS